MNPCVELEERGHSLDLGGDRGFSSLLVCQEFVSQLNPFSTPSINLAIIFTVYKLQSRTRERHERFILKYKKVSFWRPCSDVL